jgi:hypothetical protein
VFEALLCHFTLAHVPPTGPLTQYLVEPPERALIDGFAVDRSWAHITWIANRALMLSSIALD